MEQDLQVNKSSDPTPSPPPVKQQESAAAQVKPAEPQNSQVSPAEPASQFMSFAESKLLQQLQDLNFQMKQLNTRVGTVEKEIQGLKKSGGYHQGSSRWGGDKKREGTPKEHQKSDKDKKEEPKDKQPLNEKRPSP